MMIIGWFDSAGCLQKRLDRARVRANDTGNAEVEWGVCNHQHVWDSIKPFQVVGLNRSHAPCSSIPNSVLCCLEIQRKSFTISADNICKENSETSPEKTFLPNNAFYFL